MKKMKELIRKYLSDKKRLDKSERDMEKFFEKKFVRRIEKCKYIDSMIDIKEELRIMPECVGKILLFKRILHRQNEIVKGV